MSSFPQTAKPYFLVNSILKGVLSCPLLLKHPSRNARSCLLDRTASLVQVSSTPSPRIENGGSPQLRADPRPPTGRRPHPLTSASISWTARARQGPFHLLIRRPIWSSL